MAKYKVTLELADGTEYKADGSSVEEALTNLKLDYNDIKIKGTIHLEHGGKKSSKNYFVRPLRRIIVNKLRKVQVGKDLVFLLK